MSKTLRGFGGGRLVMGGGIGTVILVVLYLVLGGDPQALFNAQQQAQVSRPAQVNTQAPRDDASKFVRLFSPIPKTVGTTSSVRMGRHVRGAEASSLHGRDSVRLWLRQGSDRSVLLSARSTGLHRSRIFRRLHERLGAGGDFAEAYFIAHEVGHHVQKLLGITDRVEAARRRASEAESNRLSVRLELQADFLAGVWARYADRVKHVVETGDIEEAIRAANAVGDDRLQSRSRGYIVPDSFTHGTSEQRVRWFRRGYETGDVSQGDTFKAREL